MIMDIQAYLDRIAFAGSDLTPNVGLLRALQTAHAMHVPYENLDIYFRRDVSLAYEAMYEKIVLNRRGGYCFELNGLFGWLLRKLGFQTQEFLGRWLKGEALTVPMRRHRIIKVTFEDEAYIADVGVGQKAPRTPLLFRHGLEQERDGSIYRIVHDDRLFNVVQVLDGDSFINVFSFDDAPQEPIDFVYPHYYCTHYPDSVFLKGVFVHLPTECGRNSIGTVINPSTGQMNFLLNVGKEDGTSHQEYLPSRRDLFAALKTYFDMDFSVAD